MDSRWIKAFPALMKVVRFIRHRAVARRILSKPHTAPKGHADEIFVLPPLFERLMPLWAYGVADKLNVLDRHAA